MSKTIIIGGNSPEDIRKVFKEIAETSTLNNIPKADWEERFDDRFVFTDGVMQEWKYPFSRVNITESEQIEQIKSFISQTLERERESIRKEVEMLWTAMPEGKLERLMSNDEGYVSKKDVLDILNNKHE